MKYDLKAVYNPLKEDFKFNQGPEEYTIPSKGIILFPEFLIPFVVRTLVNQILWDKNKEIDDPERSKIETEVTSHEYEVKDLTSKEKSPKTKSAEDPADTKDKAE